MDLLPFVTRFYMSYIYTWWRILLVDLQLDFSEFSSLIPIDLETLIFSTKKKIPWKSIKSKFNRIFQIPIKSVTNLDWKSIHQFQFLFFSQSTFTYPDPMIHFNSLWWEFGKFRSAKCQWTVILSVSAIKSFIFNFQKSLWDFLSNIYGFLNV
jgi:hypothetical protein